MLDTDFIKNIDEKIEDYLLIHNVHHVIRNSKKWFRCVYPEHDDNNPSMVRVPNKNILKCFGCGRTLNIIQAFDIFHPNDKNLTYTDKIKAIAEELGVPTFEYKYSNLGQISQMHAAYNDFERIAIDGKRNISSNIQQYLKNKQIQIDYQDIGYIADYNKYKAYMQNKYTNEMLNYLSLLGKFRFGQDSLLFLLRDNDGKVVASASRYCGTESNKPKYINASNSALYNKSRMLFGMNTIKQVDSVILVEGYSDAAVLRAHGLSNTLALCGTQLTNKHMAWLKEHVRKGIVLALDGDDAGQQGMINIAAKYFADPDMPLQIAFMALPDGKDPDDVVLQQGIPALFNNIIDRIKITESMLKIKNIDVNERDKIIAKILINAERTTAQKYLHTYSKLRNIEYAEAIKHMSKIIYKILKEKAIEYNNMAAHRSEERLKIDALIDRYVNLDYWNMHNGGGSNEQRSR